MKNQDQPINPNTVHYNGKYYLGLTKREYFAGLAMQGLLSLYDNSNTLVPNEENIKSMVRMSVFASDELLKQLEQ